MEWHKLNKDKYILFDTFNKKLVSRHKTYELAEKANKELQKAVKKYHGPNSYITTKIFSPSEWKDYLEQ